MKEFPNEESREKRVQSGEIKAKGREPEKEGLLIPNFNVQNDLGQGL
jgi:hypothetical protein